MELEDFVKSLIDYTVKFYIKDAGTGSIYIVLRRFGYKFTIRISDHKPNQAKHKGWFKDIDRSSKHLTKQIKQSIRFFMHQTSFDFVHRQLHKEERKRKRKEKNKKWYQ